MRRWVHGAPNGTNDADQASPEDDLPPEPASPGPTSGEAAGDTTTDTGPATAAHGAADFGIDLDWLPEPGRTQAMHGRAAAYDDTGRCAYYLTPLGCTLVHGEKVDGNWLIDLYGHKPEGSSNGTPVVRAGSPTEPTGPRPSAASAASGPSTEVRKRSANLTTWCERCAVGIRFYCANDHALEHSGGDFIGNYGAKDIAAKSVLCHGCWSTYKPYVDESDEEEIEADINPERHPNRLRWRWPGRLKEALDAAAKRERSTLAAAGGSQAGGERAARRPKHTTDNSRQQRTHRASTQTRNDRQTIPPAGAAPTPEGGAAP